MDSEQIVLWQKPFETKSKELVSELEQGGPEIEVLLIMSVS